MGFQINTNIGALKAYNALASLNSKTQKAQLRLATQKRINSVADDTSGFNVGKSLDQKVKLMQSAQGNVGSAKDMLATAESQLISIKDMITQIKSSALLQGARGRAVMDIDSIAEAIMRLSQLAVDCPQIKELDINPMIVLEEGQGCFVADTKIII